VLALILAFLFTPWRFCPHVYPWMDPAQADHALQAKAGYLSKPGF